MDEPLFLEIEDVLDIHAEQLATFGGSGGLRVSGLVLGLFAVIASKLVKAKTS